MRESWSLACDIESTYLREFHFPKPGGSHEVGQEHANQVGRGPAVGLYVDVTVVEVHGGLARAGQQRNRRQVIEDGEDAGDQLRHKEQPQHEDQAALPAAEEHQHEQLADQEELHVDGRVPGVAQAHVLAIDEVVQEEPVQPPVLAAPLVEHDGGIVPAGPGAHIPEQTGAEPDDGHHERKHADVAVQQVLEQVPTGEGGRLAGHRPGLEVEAESGAPLLAGSLISMLLV